MGQRAVHILFKRTSHVQPKKNGMLAHAAVLHRTCARDNIWHGGAQKSLQHVCWCSLRVELQVLRCHTSHQGGRPESPAASAKDQGT
jgi:hypothetical protein